MTSASWICRAEGGGEVPRTATTLTFYASTRRQLAQVQQYLRDLGKGSAPCHLVKLVLVGEPRAGKSSLADSLVRGRPATRADSDRTVGIDIAEWRPTDEVGWRSARTPLGTPVEESHTGSRSGTSRARPRTASPTSSSSRPSR